MRCVAHIQLGMNANQLLNCIHVGIDTGYVEGCIPLGGQGIGVETLR